MRILIIEDEIPLGEGLATFFRRKGYEALWAPSGVEGLRLAAQSRPDLVVLDIMLPGMDGWEVCRRLRAASAVPIIMLTGKGAQEDVNTGLELGADDYVKKPFDFHELELRVAAVLRRAENGVSETALFDDGVLRVDLARRSVSARSQLIHLTPTEFRLLACLVRHRGRAVPHAELLREVWGPEYAQDTPNLQVYVRYLREKVEPDPARPQYVLTEWGVGYRFGG
jgi:two-component system KDP operon response regulator KdpE